MYNKLKKTIMSLYVHKEISKSLFFLATLSFEMLLPLLMYYISCLPFKPELEKHFTNTPLSELTSLLSNFTLPKFSCITDFDLVLTTQQVLYTIQTLLLIFYKIHCIVTKLPNALHVWC